MNYKKWETMTDTEKSRWHRRNEMILSAIVSIISAVIISLLIN